MPSLMITLPEDNNASGVNTQNTQLSLWTDANQNNVKSVFNMQQEPSIVKDNNQTFDPSQD